MNQYFSRRLTSAAIVLATAFAGCSGHGQTTGNQNQSAPQNDGGYATLTFNTSVPAGYHAVPFSKIPSDRYFTGWAPIVEHGAGVAATYQANGGGNYILVLTPKGKRQSSSWDCKDAVWGGNDSQPSVVCDHIPKSLLGS